MQFYFTINIIKGILWYYEKETRILLKLKGKAADFAKKNNEKYGCVVTLSFSEALKNKFQIMLAPEFIDPAEILNDDTYGAIKRHILNTSFVKTSDYKGQIKMKLKK